jgi:TolB-like protein/Flp pilus assembly protein TadD
MSLVAELRRRSVFRVAAAYLVVGWLLTEVLTTILPTLGAPEWASRAVILIFAFGFIPAVVLSWFYEITPEGIKRDQNVDRNQSGTRRAARKIDQLTIGTAVALIVVVGLFSARYTADNMSDVDLVVSDTSVAVLPFVNMSGDKDNEYFSDGLTETLLHMLAQIPDLKVAARTSSFAFKDQNLGIKAIAEALGVAHVLEGSVQRAGDQVRITAQLIRASDGFHVWSQNYDRTVDDIFAIQDEIANNVGSALSASLLGTTGDTQFAGVTTTDPDAYDLYLQARKERATYSYGGLQAAEDLLKGALLIDPGFSDAKTELASSYIQQYETGLMDRSDAIAEIIAITDQVLIEQPDDPVAKATSIYAKALSLISQGDEAAMTDLAHELETIVEYSPASLEPRLLLVRAYRALQRTDECIPLLEAALAIDPFNPTLHYELGTALMHIDRWDEARAALERSLEIEPNQPNAYTNLGMLSLREGDGVGMAKAYTNAINVDPKDHELPGMLAVFLYDLGLIDIADAFRERVMALAPTSSVAYQLDMIRAISVGDVDGSVAAARRTIEDKIEDRRLELPGAVRHLLRIAAENGRIEEELAWINAQEPGIFDVDAPRVPQRYRNVQAVAFDAWERTLPMEEVLRRLDVLLAYAESVGVDPTEDPNTHVSVLVLRGQMDEATEVALEEVFPRSVALNLNWRDTWMQPQYADITTDPRVQEAMLRWEEEEEALRGSVQSWFADMYASS